METKLPTFTHNGKTYTVDERLREFRYCVYGELPEFIPFSSPEGSELLKAAFVTEQEEYERNTVTCCKCGTEVADRDSTYANHITNDGGSICFNCLEKHS